MIPEIFRFQVFTESDKFRPRMFQIEENAWKCAKKISKTIKEKVYIRIIKIHPNIPIDVESEMTCKPSDATWIFFDENVVDIQNDEWEGKKHERS